MLSAKTPSIFYEYKKNIKSSVRYSNRAKLDKIRGIKNKTQ